MAYGEIKVNTIIYNVPSGDVSVEISGFLANGFSVASGASGVFTSQVSGAVITGNSAQFTFLTGNTAGFTTVTGTTVTGTTANFESGVFTTQVSSSVVTGNTAGFTTVTGTTVTGTTANFQSGVFTTRISGAAITGDAAGFTTVTGTTVTGTTVNFVTGNFNGTLSGATTLDSKGNVRSIPQNAQTTGYTLVASDAGKHVFTVSGVTIPSGVFVVGDAVTIYNNTTGNITISTGTNVTLRQAGATGVGNRTLATRGLATVLCVSGAQGTEFVIGGAGVT